MTFFESIFYMAWRGIAIGLIISAPMGPVGMLCIQRTLDKGRRAGFFTGIGAAISDLFYSLLTGFGLSFIEEFLERNSNIIQLAGSAVLIAFGVYLFRKNPASKLRKPIDEPVSVKKNILGGFLFTFSNPLILFLIIGLFARFNFLLPEFQLYQYLTGFVFIFVGALIWWWFITFSISKIRNHFNIRSMWLINRIIGVIIMLFAVVGIFTAVSAMASAADTKCWNRSKGFDSLSPAFSASEPGHLSNPGADTLTVMTPLEDTRFFRFQLKAHTPKPTRNTWGIILKDANGTTNLFTVKAVETAFDGISTAPALEISHTFNHQAVENRLFADNANIYRKMTDGTGGLDPTGSHNFFRLSLLDRHLTLQGGLHSPVTISEFDLPEDFHPDSVGIFLLPGASLTLDEVLLASEFPRNELIIWDDPETLNQYLEISEDPKEGYMRILDRSLNEDLLRLAGDYRLAAVRAEDGYDLIYISGAGIMSDTWKPGMVKARLSPSGIGGVWNVEWLDAMHLPLSKEVKGQYDESGTLTIQFPYQSSQLRLHPELP